MSTICSEINNIKETCPFMTEYYNKRMKIWHPYADIPFNTSNLDVLIKAIEYIENLHVNF